MIDSISGLNSSRRDGHARTLPYLPPALNPATWVDLDATGSYTEQPMIAFDHTAFLTPKQASERLRIAEDTLGQWRKRNKGPPFIRRCNRIYYNEQSLAQWFMNGDPLD